MFIKLYWIDFKFKIIVNRIFRHSDKYLHLQRTNKSHNNFSLDNQINHGAFGSVYKVTSSETFKYLFSSLLFYFLI